jgi:hypothetical protein
MRRTVSLLAFTCLLLLTSLWSAGPVAALEPVTPIEWLNRPIVWARDANQNRLDDRIDAIVASNPAQLLKVNIAFRFCFGQAHLDSVRKYAGACTYRCPLVTFACWDSLRASYARHVADFADSSVAFIELSDDASPSLATAIPATKSSDIRTNLGLDGSGKNIAFIDTGIDDGLNLALPAAKYRDGFTVNNAFPFIPVTPGNPVDYASHGTAMAAAALGVAAGGVPVGAAPAAGLYDVRINTPLGGLLVPQNWIMRALDEISTRVRAGTWNVDVICIGFNLQTGVNSATGIEPLPQLINTIVGMGIPVVVPMGNGTANPVFVDQVAVADEAITVGAVAHSGTVTTTDDVLASYSRVGSAATNKPDVVAPGSRTQAGCAGNQSCNTAPGTNCGIVSARSAPTLGACEFSGTSISAAIVAGIVAQIRQLMPRAGPQRIKQLLRQTAVDMGVAGWDPQYGAGEVDALALVNKVGGPADVRFEPVTSGLVFWESSAIGPRDADIAVGVPNALLAKVHNDGPGIAKNIVVNANISPLGNHPLISFFAGGLLGPRDTRDIGSASIAALDPGADTTVAIPWTPWTYPEGTTEWPIRLVGSQYQQFMATLDYENDTNLRNDTALLAKIVINHSLHGPALAAWSRTGAQAAPMDLIANVTNPTLHDYTLVTVVPEVVVGSGWTNSVTPSSFPLPADGCWQPVTVSLVPGAANPSGTYTVRWWVFGQPPFGPGPRDTLGGWTTTGKITVITAVPGVGVRAMYGAALALVGGLLAVSMLRRRRRPRPE